MKIGVVLLARYSSSRLPGKVLRFIAGKELLTLIFERLLRVVSKNHIIIATSDNESDDIIAGYARRHGLQCFRGSLENVAGRFLNAAREIELDYAIRINGDNLFVDITLLSEMIEIARSGRYDLVSNVQGRTFPRGMSIEIVRISHYEQLIDDIELDACYREHVTSYMYENNSGNYYYIRNETVPDVAGIQLAIDTENDLVRSARIFDHFESPHWEYNLAELSSIVKAMNYV